MALEALAEPVIDRKTAPIILWRPFRTGCNGRAYGPPCCKTWSKALILQSWWHVFTTLWRTQWPAWRSSCADRKGIGRVALSEGVLQNRLLLQGTRARLLGEGIEVLASKKGAGQRWWAFIWAGGNRIQPGSSKKRRPMRVRLYHKIIAVILPGVDSTLECAGAEC